jgi:glycosyltransferase involved in cell wall biosynthesis
LKIAYDHQIFMQKHGGISRYFAKLARGSLDLGNEVGVFSPFYLNYNLSMLPKDNIHGRYIKLYHHRMNSAFVACNKIVSRYQISQWKPDVVHETYYSRKKSGPKNCPTVITVYDMIHELFKNDFSDKDDTVGIKKIAIERSDHVICISENTRNDLVRLFNISEKKITVVHLGFDQFANNFESSENSTVSNRPFLLFVGNRSGYKNFSGFLKAVAASNRLINDFDIIAFGVSKFSIFELDLIKTLGFVKDQVRHVSGNDILLGQYYRGARAFVYPSLYEGFGISPLEAMAHQCPVVSSNSSSMPEVIGSAAEFFNPSEPEDMCNAIESVVYSDSRIADLTIRGLERLQRFSWTKCTQETLNIYRSLI